MRRKRSLWRKPMARKNKAEDRVYAAKYRAENPEKVLALRKAHAAEHKKYMVIYNKENRDSLIPKALDRRYRTKHGLTTAEVSAKAEIQGNACALCEEVFTKTPHLDHDHGCCPPRNSCSGCRRDLLCGNCNRGLGLFKDSPFLLQRAIAYLAKHAREIIVKGA